MLEVGRVYVVHTTMTKPQPKDKLVVCIDVTKPLFVWFNTDPAWHRQGQLPCTAADHPALSHDCYLDLSRVTTFLPREVEAAKERDFISHDLRARICDMVRAGIDLLPDRHAKAILDALGP